MLHLFLAVLSQTIQLPSYKSHKLESGEVDFICFEKPFVEDVVLTNKIHEPNYQNYTLCNVKEEEKEIPAERIIVLNWVHENDNEEKERKRNYI